VGTSLDGGGELSEVSLEEDEPPGVMESGQVLAPAENCPPWKNLVSRPMIGNDVQPTGEKYSHVPAAWY
jgi:hypothetical protein